MVPALPDSVVIVAVPFEAFWNVPVPVLFIAVIEALAAAAVSCNVFPTLIAPKVSNTGSSGYIHVFSY